MATDRAADYMEITAKNWKRTHGFIDTAGIKDAAGVSIKFTRMPDGRVFPPVGEDYINQVKVTNIRPDDIFVCGYPKTGCHWVFELVTMMLKGKAEYSRIGKSEGMLELVSPEVVEVLPSPRILDTHARYDELPEQAIAGRNKIILTVRNPKDSAVSMYCHHVKLKHIFDYDGKFQDWFPLYIEGEVEYGKYLDHYLSWQKAITDHPDHPILVLKYEDLKEDVPSGVRRLAAFLGVTLTDKVISDIVQATGIEAMKQHFKHVAALTPMLRKGQVGDWKNWLTVAQSEWIDENWRKQLDKTMFKTRYEL